MVIASAIFLWCILFSKDKLLRFRILLMHVIEYISL